MNTNIMNYANEVAESLEDVQVITCNKNGVDFIGLSDRSGGSNVCATMYVNDLYEAGKTVDEAADIIRQGFAEHKVPKSIDLNLESYEANMDKLSLRLYKAGNQNPDTAFISAAKYGFEDLVIVPTIIVNMGFDGSGSVQLTTKIVDEWGVDINTIISKALENVEKVVTFKTMREILIEMVGEEGAFMFPEGEGGPQQYVVTNASRVNGAAAILTMGEKLHEMFPDGYYVLPSSLHEVLVVPAMHNNINEKASFDAMVKEVNETQVAPVDVLSDHAYYFGNK